MQLRAEEECLGATNSGLCAALVSEGLSGTAWHASNLALQGRCVTVAPSGNTCTTIHVVGVRAK